MNNSEDLHFKKIHKISHKIDIVDQTLKTIIKSVSK